MALMMRNFFDPYMWIFFGNEIFVSVKILQYKFETIEFFRIRGIKYCIKSDSSPLPVWWNVQKNNWITNVSQKVKNVIETRLFFGILSVSTKISWAQHVEVCATPMRHIFFSAYIFLMYFSVCLMHFHVRRVATLKSSWLCLEANRALFCRNWKWASYPARFKNKTFYCISLRTASWVSFIKKQNPTPHPQLSAIFLLLTVIQSFHSWR